VIELGPPNATIHKVDEHVALADIAPLKTIYLGVLERLNRGAAAAASAP
jgi:succinyl-diaminopimelate desuccinylase